MIGGEIKRKSNGGNKPFLLNNFDSKVYLPTLPVLKLTLSEWDRRDCECKAVSSGSDIYLVADRRNVNCTSRFKMYFSKNISWNSLPNRKEQTFDFCVCTFMQKLFLIGGSVCIGKNYGPCMFYDKKCNS